MNAKQRRAQKRFKTAVAKQLATFFIDVASDISNRNMTVDEIRKELLEAGDGIMEELP